MTVQKPDYRLDVDGLRALAILGVLIYHICPGWLGGGYVGVDVFFVISGYLITRIISGHLQQGAFSFAGFYERRIRRIFPALFVMLSAVTAACAFYLFPADFEALANGMKKVVMGIGNFHFLKESAGYFSKEALAIPLLHTWSLAVEEQFYFVLPLLLWILHRSVKEEKWRIVILLVLFAASLAVSIHLVSTQSLTAFYLPHARAWELLLGSLISLWHLAIPPGKKAWSHGVGLAGLLLIIGSMIGFGPQTPFPGAMALIPCAGTALLLIAGEHSRHAAGWLLERKPVVFLGRISYSVYLWHWPLLALFHTRYAHVPWISGWIFLGSLIVGWLSWRWVERPFRNLRFLTRRQVYLIWGILSMVLIAAAVLIRKKDGFPHRFNEQVLHYLDYGKQPRRFHNAAAERYDAAHPQVYGDKSQPATMAIWGDSHAEALMPLMDEMAKSAGTAIQFYGTRGNPPVPGTGFITDLKAPMEEAYKEAVVQQILGNPQVRTVILHCRWTSAYLGKNEPGYRRKLGFYGQVLPNEQAIRDYYLDRIKNVVDVFLADGRRVVLVYPIPEVGMDVPTFLAQKALAGGVAPPTIPFPGYTARNKDVLGWFEQLPENRNLVKIRVAEKFLHADQLTILSNDEALYQDDDHLSSAGALFLRDLFTGVFKGD